MRLTLRTLLAYLDDVLDPVDKEELAQKIESSEFAEDLVHRTRDTVRRLRLSAPQVIGTGMGLDPNTVSEYLDNVMPPDQVGDFERICLESDVHLAEATACHHVLTMVLGEPADVDPIARQRMYTIATEAGDRKRLRIESAHTAATAAAMIPVQRAGVPAAAHAQQSRAVEVPEYLRAGPWWRSSNAVIGLAAVVLVGAAIVLLSGLRGWFRGTPTHEPLAIEDSVPPLDVVVANDAPLTTPPVAEPPTLPTDSTAAAPATRDPLGSPPHPLTPGVPPLAQPPAPPADTTTAAEPAPYAVPGTSEIATASPNTIGAADSSIPLPPLVPPSSEPSAGGGPAAVPSVDLPPPIPPPPPDLAQTTPPPTSLAGTPSALPAGAPTTPAAGAAPAAPPVSGAYMGGKTVLLRHDDQSGTWYRVEPRAAIVPGERVLALPEFRPRIALFSGIQLDLSGGTQAILGMSKDLLPTAAAPAAPEHIPSLELVYGRVVLLNPSNADKQIRLQLGSNTGLAILGHNKTLAIELERKHIPGQDPRQTPSPVEARLFAPDGGVLWHDAAGDRNIAQPSRWSLTAAGATEVIDDAAPPEWIDREPIVQLSEQRYGAPVIETTLVSNAPVDTQLLELFQSNNRKEVRSLVARSASYVDLFQPFIDALRDSDQKANWKTHIDALRGAMAVSPESADKVFQALVDQRGKPAAADLYEMLCGYNAEQIGTTPDQMKTGAVLKLINWLEDDSLDYRVLAVQDLWEITGKRLMPNPAASLAERTQNVRRWRSRLEAGELKPVTPPE
jgi:hypothetical protein